MRFFSYQAVCCFLFLFLFLTPLTGFAALMQNDLGASTLLDLKPQTVVTKKAGKVEENSNGKVYHFTYRIQARPTVEKAPKYLVDPKYSVSFTKTNFKENDTVTLLSTNAETETDSPIWVYNVAYAGAGERMIEFQTSGNAIVPLFFVANDEVDPGGNFHCYVCGHATANQCTSACYCCCAAVCNCLGCQLQNPRCFSCPIGCTCSHCVCDCDGCLSQSPRCFLCPVGCTCSHCQCLCALNIDHSGICGCANCKKPTSTCTCDCHSDCP